MKRNYFNSVKYKINEITSLNCRKESRQENQNRGYTKEI